MSMARPSQTIVVFLYVARDHRHQASVLDETDRSIYVQEEPQSRPRLGNWFVFAILAGTILAFVVVALGGLIF
jgi:hypothetical protein